MSGQLNLEQVHLWQPGNAYLYTFVVELWQDGQLLDTYEQHFGVRTVEVRDGAFLINGQPFYFKGFGKHEDFPIHGRGFNEVVALKDLNLLRRMGANSFRTAHYPYAEELMRLADRLGLVVIDEVPAVGLHLNFGMMMMSGDGQPRRTWDELETRDHHAQVIRELIERDKNHPCVVMWSIANEPAAEEEGAHAYFEPLAYSLLLQRESPSWLYAVTMGATTIWEHWDALRPDGTPKQENDVPSFNHYAFGAVADWMHRVVAGLAPLEAGYHRLSIHPRPGGGLTSAHARHRTPYGLAEVSWHLAEGQITVEAIVPPNTTALVQLPGEDIAPFAVDAGTYSWSAPFSGAITLDSPLGVLLDDARVWEAYISAATRLFPGAASVNSEFLRNGLQGCDEVPIRTALARMPLADKLLPALEKALAELNHPIAPRSEEAK